MFNNGLSVRLRDSRTLILLLGAICLLILLIRTGWAAEDAYISFRVVANFLSGYGLTWNPGERVQVYTDPLFVFLTIAATWVSGSVYWSSVVISLALTMGTYFLLMYKREASAILIGTAMLLSSKAFMDFSVSGLENPATHLGIAAFCWAYWRKREPLLLTLIASLTAVNRLDSILLFLPALLLVYYRQGWRVWKPALLGLTPLIAWELFSVFYYGFLFPNTAYAKLGSGISTPDLIREGILYVVNGYQWDKVTVVSIAAGFFLGTWFEEWPLVFGLLISIAYVVRIGGDYMSGRFLSAPFVLACAILLQHARLRWKPTLALTAAILVLGLINPRPAITTTSSFGVGVADPMTDGITDFRLFFYPASGMLRWRRGLIWPEHYWSEKGEQLRKSGERVVVLRAAGAMPYHAGPGVHVIDVGALGDPLLARLPTVREKWRPGHYRREVPPGYFETISTGVNQIQDPNLAEYYRHLHLIVAGDLWSPARLKDIVEMNLGKYDLLLPR
jgi:arabinofuranosyltransferase